MPYKRFKKMYVVDSTGALKGTYDKNFYIFIFYEQDLDSELNLRFVRIYLYATTFDRITMDRAAKFVDMLSAIGGTMGLLTGFSIISGVEIVYFGIRIILKIVKEKFNNKKNQPLKELLKNNA